MGGIDRIMTCIRMSVEGKAAALLLSEQLGIPLSGVYELALREKAERHGITRTQIAKRAQGGVTVRRRAGKVVPDANGAQRGEVG